jgi:serine/threonine protein kinase
VEQRDSLVGQTVGNYRIVKNLGVGGMGAVYLGEHPEIGSKVAIKVLLPRFVSDPQVAKRFLDEARAVNRIEHHGIVRIHDCGRQEGLGVFLVMEYLEGQTLRERLEADGVLQPQVAVRLVGQTASALIASHAAGIVHRDLKPANIFVIADPDVAGGERIKILDFGIAKLLEEREPLDAGTKTGMVLGSPLFMSPEQCIDPKRVDARTDIYSLGAIAYHLLSGGYPFAAETLGQLILKQQHEKPTPLRSLNPAASAPLEQVIHRALETDLRARFQTMNEFRAALQEDSLGDSAVDIDAPPTTVVPPELSQAPLTSTTLSGTAGEQRPAPRRRAGRALIATGAVLAVGLGFGVVSLLRGPAAPPEELSAVPDAAARPGAATTPAENPGSLIGQSERPTGREDRTSRPSQTPPASAPAKPAPRQARISLKISPEDATLELDGRRTRDNPLVLEVSKRRHLLRVKARGYTSAEERFVADGDKTLSVALKRHAAQPTAKRAPAPPPAPEVEPPPEKAPQPKAKKKGPYFNDL